MREERRIAVNQFMFQNTEWPDLIERCTRDGVTGIGVLRDTVSRLGAVETRKVLDDAGMTPTSLCVFLGLVSARAAERRILLDEARRAVDEAALLGAPLVVVAGGPAAGLDLADARRQFIDQFATLDAYATDIGGHLLLEPLNPAAVHLSAVTGLASAVRAVEACRSSGLLLDLWHVWTDPDFDAVVESHAADLHVVHVSNWPAAPQHLFQRSLPNTGLIDVPGIARRLEAAGFTGWWELEVLDDPAFGPHEDERLHAESVAALRTVLDAIPGT